MPPSLESFSGKRTLITGGAGMLGSAIALQLVRLGANVTILDAMFPQYGGNLFNLEPMRDAVHFVQGDMRDAQLVHRCVESAEYIYNLAAQVSYIDSNKALLTDLDMNCRAHITLLEACQTTGVRPTIVFASSRFVYGRIEYNPVDEKHPLNCLSIYGIHKLMAEKYHRFFYEMHGIPTVSLRIANPYGPRQQVRHSKYGIVNWFIRQALEGRPLTVYGDGRQQRDYIHVNDVAHAFLCAALSKQAAGACYNVGSGQGTPFHTMAELVAEAVPGTSVIHTAWNPENWLVETGDYVSDITNIREQTGWSPTIALRNGIAETVEYYRRYKRYYWEELLPVP